MSSRPLVMLKILFMKGRIESKETARSEEFAADISCLIK